MFIRYIRPVTRTVTRLGLAVVNGTMLGPLRALGRVSRGITRAISARAASKRELDAPIDDLWLVVGLGNPGTRYDGTRHNVGFAAVDEIARQNSIPLKRAKANAQVGLGKVAGEPVLIVKPMTFMNLSGESVGKLCRFYKVPRHRCLVVYDDLDLASGQVKLKLKGGHGGHNGMRSIIDHFGGKRDFPRLRIGIGRPENPRVTIVKHVLQRFSAEERVGIDQAVRDCVTVVESIMANGMDRALSTVNQKKGGGGGKKKRKEKNEEGAEAEASPAGQAEAN